MGKKLIGRLYAYLLELDTADKFVKDVMIKWSQNLGYNINMEDWESAWATNVKIIK